MKETPQGFEAADAEDELSPEIPLPKIDVSINTRFLRSELRDAKWEVRRAEAAAANRARLLAEAGLPADTAQTAEQVRSEKMASARRQRHKAVVVELGKELSPLALEAAKSRFASDNGRRGNEKKLKNADDEWRDPAKNLAKQYSGRAESKADYVRYVTKNWRLVRSLLPVPRTIERLITCMISAGELLPPVKRQRLSDKR